MRRQGAAVRLRFPPGEGLPAGLGAAFPPAAANPTSRSAGNKRFRRSLFPPRRGGSPERQQPRGELPAALRGCGGCAATRRPPDPARRSRSPGRLSCDPADAGTRPQKWQVRPSVRSPVLIKRTFFFSYRGLRFSRETSYQGNSVGVTEGVPEKSVYFSRSISLQCYFLG